MIGGTRSMVPLVLTPRKPHTKQATKKRKQNGWRRSIHGNRQALEETQPTLSKAVAPDEAPQSEGQERRAKDPADG